MRKWEAKNPTWEVEKFAKHAGNATWDVDEAWRKKEGEKRGGESESVKSELKRGASWKILALSVCMRIELIENGGKTNTAPKQRGFEAVEGRACGGLYLTMMR